MMLLTAINFTGCGKSKPAKTTDKLILEIGDVSLDSEDNIREAENYYESLSEGQKDEVENYKLLVDARNQYDRLVQEEKNKELKDQLEQKIGELLEQEVRTQKDVDYIIETYESLPEELQETVKNKDSIETIKELTEYEKVAVAAVNALKLNLKNEDSLKLKSIEVATGKKEAMSKYYVQIEYSAENSFGGELDNTETIDITTKYSAGFWGLSRLLSGYEQTELQLYNDFLNHSTNKMEVDIDRILNNL